MNVTRSFLFLSALALASAARAEFVPVSLEGLTNFSIVAHNGTGYNGTRTLAGVPFTTPSTGNDGWHATVATGPNPRTLTMPTDVFGAQRVYTLINNYWGQGGPTSYASLRFTADDGEIYTKNLIGNVDIRDYQPSSWTNSINGTTSIQVVANGIHRLDRQEIDLPDTFLTKRLTSIQLIDTGGENFQRVYLGGATIEAVPEPATLAGLALGGLALLRRRRK